jgi:hypothetical protein
VISESSTVGLALNATWYSLDKMLVDNVGDMTITNDGATILSLLEVTHPAVSGLTGDILECVLIEDVGPDLGFACYATGQGGRRWYDFSCTIGFRAAEKSQRAREEQDSPNDGHHWIPVSKLTRSSRE